MRIVRVCSDFVSRDTRLKELKYMLLDREYTPGIIEKSNCQGKGNSKGASPQMYFEATETNRPVFVVTFNPPLPSIPKITRKHWRSMLSKDKHLEAVFPEAPLVAFKRQNNIREHIIRAKVAPQRNERERRILNGMKKCRKCIVCRYVKEGNNINGTYFVWNINRKVLCQDSNIIYLIECNKDRCNNVTLDL